MDILAKIVAHKQKEVAETKAATPLETLKEFASVRDDQRPFARRLAEHRPGQVNIIAEIKRASPSKGIINADLDAAKQARSYECGRAAALSVLTEQAFFHGSPDDLKQARAAVALPVLRKDFIISAYQIYQAAAWGADAVLLIVRILDDRQLQKYLALCRQVGLDTLVEVHDASELARAVTAGARIIGINNRDLRHFTTNIGTAEKLASQLKAGEIAVAESGINSPDDIRRLAAAGINAFLIGESLVRAKDPAAFLEEMVHAPSSPN
jgi:indole-3-glycerol phosphate synthase